MWRRSMAVLRCVLRGARPAGAAVVPPVRPPRRHERGSMSGLSSGADRVRTSGVRVSGTGSRSGPPSEVLRLARGGRCARGLTRRARSASGRRRHLGPARGPPAGRARLRSGSRARAGARTRARSPCGRLRPKDEGDRPAGTTDAGATTGGDEGCVRMHPTEDGSGSSPPRRRRAHHGRDGLLVRGRAAGRGRPRDPSAHGVPLVRRPAPGTSRFAPSLRRCLYSGVLPSGSVVARGSTPVVDASRGRNDPRKATLGRRAWSGLEVSPAPPSERRCGRGCESAVPTTHTGRRRTPPQASVGSKTRSAGREHPSPEGRVEARAWS